MPIESKIDDTSDGSDGDGFSLAFLPDPDKEHEESVEENFSAVHCPNTGIPHSSALSPPDPAIFFDPLSTAPSQLDLDPKGIPVPSERDRKRLDELSKAVMVTARLTPPPTVKQRAELTTAAQPSRISENTDPKRWRRWKYPDFLRGGLFFPFYPERVSNLPPHLVGTGKESREVTEFRMGLKRRRVGGKGKINFRRR